MNDIPLNRFKIGQSADIDKRFANESSYRNHIVINKFFTPYHAECEKALIRHFKPRQILKSSIGQYGTETFRTESINNDKRDFQEICEQVNHRLKQCEEIIKAEYPDYINHFTLKEYSQLTPKQRKDIARVLCDNAMIQKPNVKNVENMLQSKD